MLYFIVAVFLCFVGFVWALTTERDLTGFNMPVDTQGRFMYCMGVLILATVWPFTLGVAAVLGPVYLIAQAIKNRGGLDAAFASVRSWLASTFSR